ncbi:MAG: nitrite reductase/ring-hydroxylating ferredoxin subunit [Myxococcota bacterium]|jgi:nitrite reductase/ring-hydroxylating ferredoxin subunit
MSGLHRALPPEDPTGWYALAFSRELAPGALLTRAFVGGELVVYRTEDGEVRATAPYCPHMGAHLGHGGRVEGDRIVCPFHAFAFDGSGRCVATPYGHQAPRKAQLQTWHVEEVGGVVLVWFDREGRPPEWSVPALDMTGWRPWAWRSFPLASHPQETSENSVDIGHFSVVHGYEDVREIERATVDGPLLQARYAMTRRRSLMPTIRSEFSVSVWGLGYSLVEVTVPSLGLSLRNLVLATPTGDDQIDLRIALSVRRFPGSALLQQAALAEFAADVRQDFSIWEHKTSFVRPALARGDGPVGLYRQWARQFYSSTGLRSVGCAS